MFDSEAIEKLIYYGMEEGIYPGAAISIGDKSGELFRKTYGFRQIYPEKKLMEPDTLFDIASLTKVVSTTIITLKLIQEGKLSLSDTLDKFFETPDSKKEITIHQLMTHISGLPAHVRLDYLVKNPNDVCSCILDLDLIAPPGKNVVYSCLGFILLGKICEMLGGKTIDKLANDWVFAPMGLKSAAYNPDKNNTFAVTEIDEYTGAWLDGVVHDENARFLSGISGNAGVFANIADVAKLSIMLANKGKIGNGTIISTELFEEAIKNHTTHCDEGRGLGFAVKGNMPVSCGDIFPKGSYGHTGFTGTSIWIDRETSQYVTFLTNRVHPTRENSKLVLFRREIHDCCARAYRKFI